ncbi:RpnC/YadD family protein, partial [Leptospira borgpetersenii]
RVLAISKLEQYEELTMTTAERLISEGIQQGIEQGMQQGKIEGRIEEKLEVAGKMLKKGIDLKTVLEITGFSEKTLRENGIL